MFDTRKNLWTMVVAVLLAVVFVIYLFSYQVPSNYEGVVFTLGKFSTVDKDPGLKAKWPFPIQTVRLLDTRVKLFDTKKQEALTKDKNNVIVTISTGWHIVDARKFVERLKTVESAEEMLESRVDSARNKALGEFYLHDLINSNTEYQQEKFKAFEHRIMGLLNNDLEFSSDWGVNITFLAVKQISFPADVTEKVFARMIEERSEESKRFRAEGDSQAKVYISEAESNAEKILAEAKAKAEIIKGEGDAKAAEYYKVFKENPELAGYLREIKSLRKIMASGKVTPVLDAAKHSPFNLLEKNSIPEIKINKK
ncbi:MAG: protease modulator HflC [Planctomycetota bacterium]|jgi:membrane protease subunit HflC